MVLRRIQTGNTCVRLWARMRARVCVMVCEIVHVLERLCLNACVSVYVCVCARLSFFFFFFFAIYLIMTFGMSLENGV